MRLGWHGTCYVVQTGFKFNIFLPLIPEYWGYKHVPPCRLKLKNYKAQDPTYQMNQAVVNIEYNCSSDNNATFDHICLNPPAPCFLLLISGSHMVTVGTY
jgi:hypothetical protein